eukprot:Gb_28121 [translate_table: standard]
MHKYRMLSKKGEGTFSEVLKAQCLKTNKYVAIKCMKNSFDSIEQVTSLREIQALQRLSPHPNVVKILEVLYDQPTGRLALVFELMDMNIYELIRGRKTCLPEELAKSYMYQLMKAMDHMHRNGIFHRDIKPENILIMDEVLKLADFGSCRGIYSKTPFTEYISTRWYRAPECLLTDGYYNYKMDMWGAGCVFFEILTLFPLFPGNNELDQIQKIHKILGTPPQQVLDKLKRRSQQADFKFPQQDGMGIARLIPHASSGCIELLNKLLAYNPDDRLSARQALRHAYFKDLRERDKLQKALMNATTMSLRPSPRLGICETDKKKVHEVAKNTLGDRTNNYTNRSNASSPRSMASISPLLTKNNYKGKEDQVLLQKKGKKGSLWGDKETSRSAQYIRYGDTLAPTMEYCKASTMSVYSGTEAGSTFRDLDEANEGPAKLPPIKSGYHHSALPVQGHMGHASVLQRSQRISTPKAYSMRNLKSVKEIKPTKNQKVALPVISSKNSPVVHKSGESPPCKKRVNNKYTRPYAQRLSVTNTSPVQ